MFLLIFNLIPTTMTITALRTEKPFLEALAVQFKTPGSFAITSTFFFTKQSPIIIYRLVGLLYYVNL